MPPPPLDSGTASCLGMSPPRRCSRRPGEACHAQPGRPLRSVREGRDRGPQVHGHAGELFDGYGGLGQGLGGGVGRTGDP